MLLKFPLQSLAVFSMPPLVLSFGVVTPTVETPITNWPANVQFIVLLIWDNSIANCTHDSETVTNLLCVRKAQ